MAVPFVLAALSPQAIAAIGSLGLGAALAAGLITQRQFSQIKGSVGNVDIIRPGTPDWEKAFGESHPDITTPEGYKFKWQGGEYKQLRQPKQPSFSSYDDYLNLKQTEKDAYDIATGTADTGLFAEGYDSIFNKEKVDAPRRIGVPTTASQATHDVDTIGDLLSDSSAGWTPPASLAQERADNYPETVTLPTGSPESNAFSEYAAAGIYDSQRNLGGTTTYTKNEAGALTNEQRRVAPAPYTPPVITPEQRLGGNNNVQYPPAAAIPQSPVTPAVPGTIDLFNIGETAPALTQTAGALPTITDAQRQGGNTSIQYPPAAAIPPSPVTPAVPGGVTALSIGQPAPPIRQPEAIPPYITDAQRRGGNNFTNYGPAGPSSGSFNANGTPYVAPTAPANQRVGFDSQSLLPIVDERSGVRSQTSFGEIIGRINSAPDLQSLNAIMSSAGGVNGAPDAVKQAYNNALSKFTPAQVGQSASANYLKDRYKDGGLLDDNDVETTVKQKKADGTEITIKTPAGVKTNDLFGGQAESTPALPNEWDTPVPAAPPVQPAPEGNRDIAPGVVTVPEIPTEWDTPAPAGGAAAPGTEPATGGRDVVPPGVNPSIAAGSPGTVAPGVVEGGGGTATPPPGNDLSALQSAGAAVEKDIDPAKKEKVAKISTAARNILSNGGSRADVGKMLQSAGNDKYFTDIERRYLIMAGLQLLGGSGIDAAVRTASLGFTKGTEFKQTQYDRQQQQIKDKRTTYSDLLSKTPNATLLNDDGTRIRFSSLPSEEQNLILDQLTETYVNDPERFVDITNQLGIEGFGVPSEASLGMLNVENLDGLQKAYYTSLSPSNKAIVSEIVRNGDATLKQLADSKKRVNDSISYQVGIDDRKVLIGQEAPGRNNEAGTRKQIVQSLINSPETAGSLSLLAESGFLGRKFSGAEKWTPGSEAELTNAKNLYANLVSMITYARTGAALNEQELENIKREFGDEATTTTPELQSNMQRLLTQHIEPLYKQGYELSPQMLLLRKYDYDLTHPDLQKVFSNKFENVITEQNGETKVKVDGKWYELSR